jgi:predicted Rossmann fold nucleotide-binding protein DprA/Smf involved in DNA uptake
MAGAGLVELARKFVDLSDQLEATRGEIARAVLNGEGPRENPTPAPRPGVKGSQSSHPNAAKAAEAEETILNLLKTRPMRMAEITAATESKQSTTSERLRRLRQRGLVVLAGGAWAATA